MSRRVAPSEEEVIEGARGAAPAERPPEPPGWLSYSAFSTSVQAGGQEDGAGAAMLRWLQHFLSSPMPGDPRRRVICSGFGPSAAAGLTYFRSSALTEAIEPELTREIELRASEYTAFAGALAQSERPLLGLLVLFPHLEPACWPLLDRVKEALDARFEEAGLAARGFYPGHTDRALRNPQVLIAQAPVPAFGIRPMMAHDGEAWVDRRRARK